MKILVINGPNINMLGIREPKIYGTGTYRDLLAYLKAAAEEREIEIDFFQSNHEGALVDEIQKAYGCYHGIVFNPAAYTHTSIALLDAVKAVGIPTVEVHLSNLGDREDFRQTSYVGQACIATINGKGFDGYVEALDTLLGELYDKE